MTRVTRGIFLSRVKLILLSGRRICDNFAVSPLSTSSCFIHPQRYFSLTRHYCIMSSPSSPSLQTQVQPLTVAVLSLALNIPALRDAIGLSWSEEPISRDEWDERMANDVDVDDIYDDARSNVTALAASIRIAKLRAEAKPSEELISNPSEALDVIGKYDPCQLELTRPRQAYRTSREIPGRSSVSNFDFNDLEHHIILPGALLRIAGLPS